MTTTIDELRNKCRTCRYLARNEDNASSGYCWQSDKPIDLLSYASWPNQLDPICADVCDGESAWEPLRILEPYFGGANEEGADR